MFLQFNLKETKNHHVFYKLTDVENNVLHLGVVEFHDLFYFRHLKKRPDMEVYLTIIVTLKDKLKLMNAAIRYCHENNLHQFLDELDQQYKSWIINRKSKQVRCITTGEVFDSATETALKHGLTYNQLVGHLNRRPSFNSVKGKKYEYIC